MSKSRKTKTPGKTAGLSPDEITELFPGVSYYKDRHGKLRWRYRDGKTIVNLGADYGSPDFVRRYTAAIKGEQLPREATSRGRNPVQYTGPARRGQHSLSELIDCWYRSAQFSQLAETSVKHYTGTAEHLRRDYGDNAVETLTRGTVRQIIQRKADRPESANLDLKILRLLMDHAMDVEEWVETNPARAVKKLRSRNRDGFYTWTEDDIETFRAFWPVGTLADLAMSLMLFTGAARADAVRMGPDNIRIVDGTTRLVYRRQKMQHKTDTVISIRVHPELAMRINPLMDTHTTFLQVAPGHPRSASDLGNKMRIWCDTAGLRRCTSHGLRKACARRLTDAGSTAHEIMSVTGHETLSEVERYTKKFDRLKLADRAIDRLSPIDRDDSDDSADG